MKLSAEQYAQLAASFEGGEPAIPDRRRAARLDIQARVKITPIVSGQRQAPMTVIVSNFSPRGLSLMHPTGMAPGEQFITELPRKEGGIVELLCTVAHCVPVNGESFKVGAEFTCTVRPMIPGNESDDQLQMKRIRESMLG
jgi:hypothetical protein